MIKYLVSVFIISLSAYGNEANNVFKQHADNLAQIITKNNKFGTGFFISSDLIITNRHVVTGLNKTTNTWDAPDKIIKKNGQVFTRYELMYCSKRVDLCLISLKKGTLSTKDSWPIDRNIQVGEELFIIGYPSGVPNAIITPGIATSEKWKVPWEDYKGNSSSFDGFSTNAPISPGSSGSPVFSKNGFLIGIAVGSLTNSQNLNFIISANELNLFLDKIGLNDMESIGVMEYGYEIQLNQLTQKMLADPKIEGTIRNINQQIVNSQAHELEAQKRATIKSAELKKMEINKHFFLLGGAMKAGDYKEERVHLNAIMSLTSIDEDDHQIALRRLDDLNKKGK